MVRGTNLARRGEIWSGNCLPRFVSRRRRPDSPPSRRALVVLPPLFNQRLTNAVFPSRVAPIPRFLMFLAVPWQAKSAKAATTCHETHRALIRSQYAHRTKKLLAYHLGPVWYRLTMCLFARACLHNRSRWLLRSNLIAKGLGRAWRRSNRRRLRRRSTGHKATRHLQDREQHLEVRDPQPSPRRCRR